VWDRLRARVAPPRRALAAEQSGLAVSQSFLTQPPDRPAAPTHLTSLVLARPLTLPRGQGRPTRERRVLPAHTARASATEATRVLRPRQKSRQTAPFSGDGLRFRDPLGHGTPTGAARGPWKSSHNTEIAGSNPARAIHPKPPEPRSFGSSPVTPFDTIRCQLKSDWVILGQSIETTPLPAACSATFSGPWQSSSEG